MADAERLVDGITILMKPPKPGTEGQTMGTTNKYRVDISLFTHDIRTAKECKTVVVYADSKDEAYEKAQNDYGNNRFWVKVTRVHEIKKGW